MVDARTDPINHSAGIGRNTSDNPSSNACSGGCSPTHAAAAPDTDAPEARGLQEFLDAAAADRIRAVLAETGGVRIEAARRLGVDRTTLYRLMRKFGITGEG